MTLDESNERRMDPEEPFVEDEVEFQLDQQCTSSITLSDPFLAKVGADVSDTVDIVDPFSSISEPQPKKRRPVS